MPDLGWDATEELDTQDTASTIIENTEEIAKTVQILPETINSNTNRNIPRNIETTAARNTPNWEKYSASSINSDEINNCNGFLKRINQAYRKAVQAVTHATRTTSHNISAIPKKTANRNQAKTAKKDN